MSQRKNESRRMKQQRVDTRVESALIDTLKNEALAVTGTHHVPEPDLTAVDSALAASQDWMLAQQNPEGYWCAEFEADTTLESYFIIFKWMWGHREHPKIPKYAKTILEAQLPEGGWATYEGGPPEISVSTLSYLALKLAGTPASDPQMIRARDAILKLGGATKANTYTKYHLAFFGQYDWNHVPAIPPEMILVPTVSPFHIYDMSSWSRTIFVSLSVIYAHKPTIEVPKERGTPELFVENSDLALQKDKDSTVTWKNLFLFADKGLKVAEKLPISIARNIALKKAEKWILERMPKSGGLSAILPAMQNSILALWCMGYKEDHPWVKHGIHELEMLEMERDAERIECQPCVSPVWDTCIAAYALGQSGMDGDHPAMKNSAAWLLSKQCTDPGDWQVHNPMPPGGWYFEFLNEFYPDVDDTCMTLMALRYANGAGKLPPLPENKLPVNGVQRGFLGAEAPTKVYSEADQKAAIERGVLWMLGMQNDDGGWASFDKGNDKEWLTKVPFADHNAMIDPSTSDITSRVLESLSYQDEFHLERCKSVADKEKVEKSQKIVRRAIEFIKKDQCSDGSWFGRWGVNYIYGTWQVLRGLRLIGEDMNKGYLRRGVEWFKHYQNPDGGWGETIGSYDDISLKGKGESTKSQTAWALMGLINAGQGNSQSVRRGVKYLLDTMTPEGTWEEAPWTGTGFPRVFYMKYHYYRHYFPLMALGQYSRFKKGLPY